MSDSHVFKKRITAISIYVRNCADTNRADRESMDIDNDTMAVECNSIEISIIVFANAFISVTYVLNGRKVTAKLLKRLEKMKI